MVSKGVMKINEGFYKVGCACGSSDCDLRLIIDKESINVYSELSWNDWKGLPSDNCKFISRIWNRVKVSIRVLFKGKVELSSELIISDKEHAINIAKILEEMKFDE